MAFGSLDTDRAGHNSPLLAWGVLCAIVACVPTGWVIVKRADSQREEITLERIVEVVDALHQAKSDVSRLH